MSRYSMVQGSAKDIVEERRRQIQDCHHYPSDDDQYQNGELLMAALAYLCSPGEALWPFLVGQFHPSDDPLDNLIKAGALIAAEADRLKRAKLEGRPVQGGFLVLAVSPQEVDEMFDGLTQIQQEMRQILEGILDV
jgi:hypothetical protein